MSYKVEFLNDEAFDALPGNDMPSKVGVAYPSVGIAYVRQSGLPVLDAFTAAHELEHLKGDDLNEHFDTEHGAYYKKLNEFFQSAAPIAASFIPGVGPLVSGAMGATNSFGLFGKSPGQVQQQNQMRDQEGGMSGFQPSSPMPEVSQAPNTFPTSSGNSSGAAAGGVGGGAVSKLKQYLQGGNMGSFGGSM